MQITIAYKKEMFKDIQKRMINIEGLIIYAPKTRRPSTKLQSQKIKCALVKLLVDFVEIIAPSTLTKTAKISRRFSRINKQKRTYIFC